MMRATVFILLCAIILCAWRPAFADSAAALTEVYGDNGLPEWGKPKPEGLHGLLGPALFRGDRIIGDPRPRTTVFPFVLMTWDDFAYWSITGGGVWLLHFVDLPLRIGAGVKVHPGYRPENNPDLTGMEKRQPSVDGYVNALWKMELVNIGATFYHDIGRVTGGDAVTVRLSHHIPVTPKITLTPRAGVEYQNASLVRYYYGVTPSEALPDRPEYTGHHAVNYGAGAAAVYRLTPSWSLLGGFFATHLGNGISDSPIVLKRHTKVWYFGGGWTF
jgi:outer membrane scaffolding protein for murein synthesis (MipA/OmpV family)